MLKKIVRVKFLCLSSVIPGYQILLGGLSIKRSLVFFLSTLLNINVLVCKLVDHFLGKIWLSVLCCYFRI